MFFTPPFSSDPMLKIVRPDFRKRKQREKKNFDAKNFFDEIDLHPPPPPRETKIFFELFSTFVWNVQKLNKKNFPYNCTPPSGRPEGFFHEEIKRYLVKTSFYIHSYFRLFLLPFGYKSGNCTVYSKIVFGLNGSLW